MSFTPRSWAARPPKSSEKRRRPVVGDQRSSRPQWTGWVDGGWATVSNTHGVPVLPTPPVPATAALIPPGADEPQAAAIVNTYVRSGPATSYPAYGIAQAGASARVLGQK